MSSPARFGAAALVALLSACAPESATDDPLNPGPTQPVTLANDSELAPRYAAVQAAQESRLSHLRFLDCRGVVEIRYTEDGSEHFDQCDLHLYAVLPDQTALLLAKLGSLYAWIGSDDSRWWVFRVGKVPKTLDVQPWIVDQASESSIGNVGGFSVVSPRGILLLAGMAPLPLQSEVTLGSDAKSLIAEARGGANRARYTFDNATLLPSRIEILNESGAVIATGELDDYEHAPADGIALGDAPMVPKRILVTRADSKDSIRLQFDKPSARAVGIKARFFDLNDLQTRMQPDLVTWREPPAPQAQW